MAKTNTRDDFLDAALTESRKKFGDKIGIKPRIYGIPITTLAEQYLFYNTVIPLEITMLVAGPKASCKSAYAFSKIRDVIKLGGYGRVFDTELKWNPHFAESIIGPDDFRLLQHHPCETIDEWQKAVNQHLEFYVKTFEPNKDPSKRKSDSPSPIPGVWVVDSLTGKTSQDARDKAIKEDGEIPFGYQAARDAAHISGFFKHFSLLYTPVILICVRHEKDNLRDPTGHSKNTPGGHSPDFMGALDVRFKRVGKFEKATQGGANLRVTVEKNNFGPFGRKVDVDFVWEFVDDQGDSDEFHQVSYFDWENATANLLASLCKTPSSGVREVLEVTVDRKRYTCKQLDLKGVEGQDLARAVHADDELMKDLQKVLHIKRRPAFDPDHILSTQEQ